MRIDNTAQGTTVDIPPEESAPMNQSLLQGAASAIANALKDGGAVDTIEQLKGDEANENFTIECNEQGMMMLVPTGNQLTGAELNGYVLQGTMDKGGELNELQQFSALRGQMGDKMDPAAHRVLDVVDKWVGIMQANGQTELTPEQKAQFSAELSEAAKPRERDHALPLGADPPLSPGGEVVINPFVDLGPIMDSPQIGVANPNAVNTGSLAETLRPEGQPGPNGLPYPYK